MPVSAEERQRARLARALANFWAGGLGPTHDDITFVLDMFEIDVSGTKRERISAALKQVDHQDLISLLEELIDLLRSDRESSDWTTDGNTVDGLADALAPYGITLLEEFRITAAPGSLVDTETLPEEAAVRQHAERLRLAIAQGDSALLLGSSKELLESTAKIVLSRVGEMPPARYPALITRALEILMIHPKSEPTQREDEIASVRKILGGVLQIAIEINSLRNERGTGHGRAEAPVNLTSRHGRLAAGAAHLVATLMFDTLDDESAPWRHRTGECDQTSRYMNQA